MPSGSCLCHNLKYNFTGKPLSKAVCHCLSCRKISGGTHTLSLLIPEDKFQVTAGKPRKYTETHESGMGLTVNSCENCGCAVWKIADNELLRGSVVLLAGTLDDPDALAQAKPEVELYTKYRVPWISKLDWAGQRPGF